MKDVNVGETNRFRKYVEEEPDNSLSHHGIKGMHWGVRNAETLARYSRGSRPESHETTTKYGETLVLERNRGNKVFRGLQKVNRHIADEAGKTYNYDLKVGKKNVGSLQMYQKPNKEMNIVWGSVKEKYRQKGYMTAAIAEGERIAKSLGNKKITGELVGNSPGGSIHKLAKNRGYVKKGEIRTKEVMDAWGGLTLIEKKL